MLFRSSVDRRDVLVASLEQVLPRADVIKVSGDDLDYLFPGQSNLPAAQQLAADRDAVVLFTDGANAVHVLTSGRRGAAVDVVLDVPRVPVVDTVGAGDSFSGGFLAHWIGSGRGRDDLDDVDALVEAARYGIRVAGITCQRAGANPPFAKEVPTA